MPNCHPADLPGPAYSIRVALERLQSGIPLASGTPESILRPLVLEVWEGAYNQGRDDGLDSILAVLHREATLAALTTLCGEWVKKESSQTSDDIVDDALRIGDAFAAALRKRAEEKKP